MTTTLEHPPVQQPPARTAVGVLDVDAGGKGRLRPADCLPTPNDLQVPAALIRRHGLRKGDLVEGVRGAQRTLTEVALVDGVTPDALHGRRNFRDLTLCFSRSCNGAAGLRARYDCVPSVDRMTWGVVSPGPWGAVGDADERPGHRPVWCNAGQFAGGRSA
ncbi:hypothetical protein [Streptomyces scabiei]|uniref:hypothetical protein n=1 Tax=Streptomyces scabiei TaxID=1930 RepID=UPI0039F4F4D6